MPAHARATPGGPSLIRRTLGVLTLAITALSVTGCGAVWRSATGSRSVAPSGLPWGDELLRRSLVMGTFDQALAQLDRKADGAPDDALLRALFRGQVAFYAGDWAGSTAAFADADRLTDERFTKSASRGALAMLTNDRALLYVPARTERLFSPYYAMLARVQSGDVVGAAVDARRLSALLEADASDLEPEERATHAALRDVAGAVFEAAGEWNDASVAYRNAALLRGVSRDSIDAIAVHRSTRDSATLLVVVESGFVAHYVEQTLALPTGGPSVVERPRRRRPVASVPALDGVEPRAPTLDALRAMASEPSRGSTRDLTRLVSGDWSSDAARDAARDAALDAALDVAQGATRDAPRDQTADAADPKDNAARFLMALDALPEGGVFFDDEPTGVEPRDSGEAGPLGASANVGVDWTPRRRGRTRYLGARSWSHGWLQISWPSLLRPRLPSAPSTIELVNVSAAPTAERAAEATAEATAEGTSAAAAIVSVPRSGRGVAELSDAIGADARRLRGARLARLTVRTVTRVAAVDAVRDKHGDAAAAVASLFASALERADTRAWHLLPGRLSIVRITVPVGQVQPTLFVGATANRLPVPLAAFNAAPGSVHVRTARIWRDPAGTPAGILADGSAAAGREIMRPH